MQYPVLPSHRASPMVNVDFFSILCLLNWTDLMDNHLTIITKEVESVVFLRKCPFKLPIWSPCIVRSLCTLSLDLGHV